MCLAVQDVPRADNERGIADELGIDRTYPGTYVRRATAHKSKRILQRGYTHTPGMQQVHRALLHVADIHVHSRACIRHASGIFPLSLSLSFSHPRSSLVLPSFRSSARFLLLRSLRELVVVPVFRALMNFSMDRSSRPNDGTYHGRSDFIRDSWTDENS